MIALGQAIGELVAIDGGWRGHVPDNWLQGRTAYGGFSAALALHAAMASDQDLPPLRSAQIAFVGPLSGAITIRARRLRRGRNATFVQAEVESDAGIGLSAIFVFMAAIESRLDHHQGTTPTHPRPRPGDRTWFGIPEVAFTQNFEFVDQREGLAPAEWLRWSRLRDRSGLDPAIELVAMADSLPPAALKLLGGFAPLSSMTWLLNLLVPAQPTTDGWWLLRSQADHAAAGHSSQTMAIWDAEGRAVAEQMQSVAIFA